MRKFSLRAQTDRARTVYWCFLLNTFLLNISSRHSNRLRRFVGKTLMNHRRWWNRGLLGCFLSSCTSRGNRIRTISVHFALSNNQTFRLQNSIQQIFDWLLLLCGFSTRPLLVRLKQPSNPQIQNFVCPFHCGRSIHSSIVPDPQAAVISHAQERKHLLLNPGRGNLWQQLQSVRRTKTAKHDPSTQPQGCGIEARCPSLANTTRFKKSPAYRRRVLPHLKCKSCRSRRTTAAYIIRTRRKSPVAAWLRLKCEYKMILDEEEWRKVLLVLGICGWGGQNRIWVRHSWSWRYYNAIDPQQISNKHAFVRSVMCWNGENGSVAWTAGPNCSPSSCCGFLG